MFTTFYLSLFVLSMELSTETGEARRLKGRFLEDSPGFQMSALPSLSPQATRIHPSSTLKLCGLLLGSIVSCVLMTLRFADTRMLIPTLIEAILQRRSIISMRSPERYVYINMYTYVHVCLYI